jgi:hypothetical protein
MSFCPLLAATEIRLCTFECSVFLYVLGCDAFVWAAWSMRPHIAPGILVIWLLASRKILHAYLMSLFMATWYLV